MSGIVWLIGAGPGQPGLLTIHGGEAIREADAVRHREGCNLAILDLARPGADVAPWKSREDIVELAREGRNVAVLYPGDPYSFGDGAGFAELLGRLKIDFEAIPGLLLETAAPLMSGIPLTIEGLSASILLGSGSADSVVLRLDAAWLESGVRSLVESGRSSEEPAALVFDLGGNAQRRLEAALGELPKLARMEGLSGEALVVVGPGVKLASRLDSLARRPLHRRRILVTRARHQAEAFRRQLVALGASVIEIPTIEIRPVSGGEQVKRAIGRLAQTGLVVFASANAVEIFFGQLFDAGRDARSLHSCRICAIGPETARTLEERGLRADLVAGEYTAEGLAEALMGWEMSGVRVLVPRARVARDALPALLAQRGAEVEILPVYETVPPPGVAERLRRLLAAGGLDAVTFTSSSTVSNFAQAFGDGELPGLLQSTRVACMGPVTAQTARKLGMRVDIIAREYTTRGLAVAIAEAFG